MAFLSGPIRWFLLLSLKKKRQKIQSLKCCVFYSATTDLVQNFSHVLAICKRHIFFKVTLHLVVVKPQDTERIIIEMSQLLLRSGFTGNIS